MKAQTRALTDNGLNPIWDEEFSFEVASPSLTMLHFRVMDRDIDDDDFVAFAGISLSCLREGFRNVPLSSSSGSRANDFQFARLFCCFSVIKI